MPNIITSERYDGVLCKLITSTGQDVQKGDTVKDFRGDLNVIVGGRAPHKSSSQGKVWTDDFGPQYYPSVFKLQWVPV